MKNLKLLIILSAVMLTSCKLDPSYVSYTNAVITLDEKSYPDSGIVDTPFNIYAHCIVYNNCWSGLHFQLSQNSDIGYLLAAYGNFVSYGSCAEITLTADTVISFTPTEAGDYTFITLLSPDIYTIDTVVVVAAEE